MSVFENQNANADVRVEIFEFGDVPNGHRERESCGVEFVQMGFIVCETICMMVDGVNSRQYGPEETQVVCAILHVDNRFFSFQFREGLE